MTIRTPTLAAAALASLMFGGCASIVSGQNQSVSVTSRDPAKGADLAGAKCSLVNDKGTWYATTPGTVTVRRSFNELAVNCTADGIEPDRDGQVGDQGRGRQDRVGRAHARALR